MIHFVTDSYPMQVKRISCDKEVGGIKTGWHACNAAATFEKESRFSDGMFLHYCKRHAPYGARPVFNPSVKTPTPTVKTPTHEGYPGGEDQREMDEIELSEFQYCECGEDHMFDEEDTDTCFSCGKAIGGYTNVNPNGDMEAA